MIGYEQAFPTAEESLLCYVLAAPHDSGLCGLKFEHGDEIG
nr:hypothetical protein [Paenibacillus xylanexedens]